MWWYSVNEPKTHPNYPALLVELLAELLPELPNRVSDVPDIDKVCLILHTQTYSSEVCAIAVNVKIFPISTNHSHDSVEEDAKLPHIKHALTSAMSCSGS